MEPVKYIKDMLKIHEGTIIDGAVDMGLSAIPLLGEAFQSYRIGKLEKRMKKNIKQLEIIKDKVESSKNEVFYKFEVFPLIVKQIMNEDQEEKIKVIIDGFEHIVDNDLHEIEKIYHYYDVLEELRYSDILLFIEKSMQHEWFNDYGSAINAPTQEELASIKMPESEAIMIYQVNKLLKLGLLMEADFTDEFRKKPLLYMHEVTDFGNEFLNMYSFTER